VITTFENSYFTCLSGTSAHFMIVCICFHVNFCEQTFSDFNLRLFARFFKCFMACGCH